MKRQVIQNVLALPGLAGVAVIDGHNRPGWIGLTPGPPQPLDNALAQDIQQVIATTPAGFALGRFRFRHQVVSIHKLSQGVTLLVLGADQPGTDYASALGQLQALLMEDPLTAVQTFRELATAMVAEAERLTAEATATGDASLPGDLIQEPRAASSGLRLPEVTATLNRLSDGAAQYLGPTLVANAWKLSRPAQPWLEQFEIQKTGHVKVSAPGSAPLTAEQHQWLSAWVAAFLGRGGRTIRNFSALVTDTALTPEERAWLLGPTADSAGSPSP